MTLREVDELHELLAVLEPVAARMAAGARSEVVEDLLGSEAVTARDASPTANTRFPDSTSSVRLTRTPRANEGMPDWNAAGTLVAFSTCGRGKFSKCEIWTMNADGSDPTRLTNTPDSQETWPTWSPDGTQIAYTSNASDAFQDIWVMDSDGTDQTKLTENRRHEFALAFSPDETRIAFNKEGANGRLGVWIMLANGSSPEQQTFGLFDFFPDWQPV